MNSTVGSGVSGVRVTYRSSFASQLLAVRYVMFGRIRKSPSSRAAQASAESCARTDADAAASNTAMISFFFIDPPSGIFHRERNGRYGHALITDAPIIASRFCGAGRHRSYLFR